jgi:hypothetical protein
MFADPAPTAVATPLELTVATPVFELDHVIVRPVSVLPLASRATAENVTELPTVALDVEGVTETDATGVGGGGGDALTVSAAEPFCPSLVATIFAEPALTAVTTPLPLTEAIPALELDHAIARPVSVLPLASRRVAVALLV